MDDSRTMYDAVVELADLGRETSRATSSVALDVVHLQGRVAVLERGVRFLHVVGWVQGVAVILLGVAVIR